MKILQLSTITLLPDSFTGSLSDALVYLGTLAADETPLPEYQPGGVSIRVAPEPFYQNQRYGFKTVTDSGIYALRHGAWVRHDKNPRVCYAQGSTWIK